MPDNRYTTLGFDRNTETGKISEQIEQQLMDMIWRNEAPNDDDLSVFLNNINNLRDAIDFDDKNEVL